MYKIYVQGIICILNFMKDSKTPNRRDKELPQGTLF